MIHEKFESQVTAVARFDDKQLAEHPEGGRFVEIYRSSQPVQKQSGEQRSALTHIYFSLGPGEISRFHRVESDEVWNLYQGAVVLYIWDETTELLETYELSEPSRTFCVVVEAGKWQAAEAKGGSVLVGCSVAPGFEFDDFTLMRSKGDVVWKALEKYPELSRFM